MKASSAIVFVVDDDSSLRKALDRLIKSAGLNIRTFASAGEFLGARLPKVPGCLVLDVKMPGLSGFDLQQELVRANIDIPIIFITGHGDIPMAIKAMKAGAVDFLPKPFDDKELLYAVERAIDKDIRTKKEQAHLARIQRRLRTLTPREHEVFRWVITGMLNKQIAYKLGIVEKTIKVHRARLMKKMQVTSVAELVRLAQEINLIPPKR